MLLFVQRVLVLTILMNAVLQLADLEQYGKYLRFVSGCLLAIYILSPIAGFLSGESNMTAFGQWFSGELSEGERPGDESDLLPYYVHGAETQLLGALRSAGLPVAGVRVSLSVNGGTPSLATVTVIVSEESATEQTKNYLKEVYNLPEQHIHCIVVEDGNGETIP